MCRLSSALFVLAFAVAPAAQPDPCRQVGFHPIYGTFLRTGTFKAWGHVEFVPTAAGIALLVYAYYPPFHLLPEWPLVQDPGPDARSPSASPSTAGGGTTTARRSTATS